VKRFWRSRAFRKFRRNRLAVVASVVIGVYLVIAAFVFAGGISRDQVFAQVGPRSVPGFGVAQDAEKRVEDALYLVRRVERALGRADVGEALAEIRLGRRRVADRPVGELRAAVAEANAIVEGFEGVEDLTEAPERLPEIEKLEDAAASLYAPLEGWDAFVQGFNLWLGTDRQGRSIAMRAFYSIKVAIQIGVVTSLVAVIFGGLLGAAAGYFGGSVDYVVQWLYSVVSSVPYLVLLGLLVYMFSASPLEQTLVPVYVAFGATFWVGPCRVVRGETLRVKELDYVMAANALGQERFVILLRHIVPNVAHLLFVNFSLLFIAAIKSEVILTFLGLGVKNEPSWGIMISQSASEVVNQFFWQIGSATALMFLLVLAFNVLTDALQDALDPKHIA